MLKIENIKNITLSTSFQAVSVTTSLLFSGYIACTQDGTDFEIKLTDSDTETFVCSTSMNTSPLNVLVNRNYESDNSTVFYVKGVDSSVLQLMFIRE